MYYLRKIAFRDPGIRLWDKASKWIRRIAMSAGGIQLNLKFRDYVLERAARGGPKTYFSLLAID